MNYLGSAAGSGSELKSVGTTQQLDRTVTRSPCCSDSLSWKATVGRYRSTSGSEVAGLPACRCCRLACRRRTSSRSSAIVRSAQTCPSLTQILVLGFQRFKRECTNRHQQSCVRQASVHRCERRSLRGLRSCATASHDLQNAASRSSGRVGDRPG